MNDATARARILRDAGVSFNVIAKTLTAEGYLPRRAVPGTAAPRSGCSSLPNRPDPDGDSASRTPKSPSAR